MSGHGKGRVISHQKQREWTPEEEEIAKQAEKLLKKLLTNKSVKKPWDINWDLYPELCDWIQSFETTSYEVKNPLVWETMFRENVVFISALKKLPEINDFIARVFHLTRIGAIDHIKDGIFAPNLYVIGFLISTHLTAQKDHEAVQLFSQLMYTSNEDVQKLYEFQEALKEKPPKIITRYVKCIHAFDVKFSEPEKDPTFYTDIATFLHKHGFLPKSAADFFLAFETRGALKKRPADDYASSPSGSVKAKKPSKKPKKKEADSLQEEDADEDEDEDEQGDWKLSTKSVYNVQVGGLLYLLFLLLVLPMAAVALGYGAQALQHEHHDCREKGHNVKFSVAVFLVVLGSVGIFASLGAIFDYYLNMKGKDKRPLHEDTQTLITTVRWILVAGLLFVLSWTASGAALYAEDVNHACRNSDTGKVALSAIIIHGSASLISIIWVLFKTTCFEVQKW